MVSEWEIFPEPEKYFVVISISSSNSLSNIEKMNIAINIL